MPRAPEPRTISLLQAAVEWECGSGAELNGSLWDCRGFGLAGCAHAGEGEVNHSCSRRTVLGTVLALNVDLSLASLKD
ncbi:uncharacterized [Tachysurus ichikawai]